jgi:hypothetical protein
MMGNSMERNGTKLKIQYAQFWIDDSILCAFSYDCGMDLLFFLKIN